MSTDSRRLTLIISRAAHQLHATVPNVATTLLDVEGSGRMLFSNSALAQVRDMNLLELSREYAERGRELGIYPYYYAHRPQGDMEVAVYFTLLDERHVLTIIAKSQYESRIIEFCEHLRDIMQESEDDSEP